MTLTIKVRLPAVGTGPREWLRLLLPVAEPAILLAAEAAGAGLAGQIVCATAVRATRRVLEA